VKQFPGNLKGDKGLAGAGGEGQQDARFPGGDPLQYPVDRDILVIARLEKAAPVLERHRGKAVAPRVRLGKGQVPQLVRRREMRHSTFLAGLHVDAVNALPVGRVRVANGELPGVILGLRHALGDLFVPSLRLDNGEFVIAMDQHVVGGERLTPSAVAFNPAESDRIFAPDAASFDHAPARRRECGVDMLGSGLGFVHRRVSRSPTGNSVSDLNISSSFPRTHQGMHGCRRSGLADGQISLSAPRGGEGLSNQPAAASAGSMCSALVSASFMVRVPGGLSQS
jgi:hypothetical protein